MAARVEVEVERRRRDEEEGEAGDRYFDRKHAGDEGEEGVQRPDEWSLRMDVDGLDLGAAPRIAQTAGHRVCGAALGVRAGQAPLERAELVDRCEPGVAPCRPGFDRGLVLRTPASSAGVCHGAIIAGSDAAGGNRTHKPFRAMDFESISFTSLDTAARPNHDVSAG